jgi:hypothetical protein
VSSTIIMANRSAPVQFDFDGSLRLARLSWQTADELELTAGGRHDLAVAALTDWSGVYGEQFAGRIDDEMHTTSIVARQLRDEAGGWAIEWKQAMDQANYNRYQDACDRIRDDRGFLDTVGGALFGHDDLPPTPQLADTPQPPSFAATRRFADYSSY